MYFLFASLEKPKANCGFSNSMSKYFVCVNMFTHIYPGGSGHLRINFSAQKCAEIVSSKTITSIIITGNLCRCTGYRPIIDGLSSFADKTATCPLGEACCRNEDNSSRSQTNVYDGKGDNFKPYDPSQEPIFPPELKVWVGNALR